MRSRFSQPPITFRISPQCLDLAMVEIMGIAQFFVGVGE
jgi:hypothetical protein